MICEKEDKVVFAEMLLTGGDESTLSKVTSRRRTASGPAKALCSMGVAVVFFGVGLVFRTYCEEGVLVVTWLTPDDECTLSQVTSC